MQNNKVRLITQSALIAAVYTVLTLALAPLSFGQMQVRVSEALTLLCVFSPSAVIGVTLGCAISNAVGFFTGANILGAGTDTIKIRGVDRLRGGSYAIIPDQIEAGTYMAAAAAAGGQILVKNIIPKHMDCITAKLLECGVEVEEHEDTLLVRRNGPLRRANIKTLPYPGFPTDMQPQITTVLSLAQGISLVTESVWSSRYRYVDELRRMGANIQVDDKTAVVEGVDHLVGAPIQASDLRAGAALVIAALAARGESEISCVHYIERGYENLVEKLRGLGANIRAVDEPEDARRLRLG